MKSCFGIAIMLLGLTGPAAAKCRFQYTPQIEQGIVEPAFEKAFAGHRLGYDPHKPTIQIKNRSVELWFQNLDPAYLDCDFFVVTLENCGDGPSRAEFVSWIVQPSKHGVRNRKN